MTISAELIWPALLILSLLMRLTALLLMLMTLVIEFLVYSDTAERTIIGRCFLQYYVHTVVKNWMLAIARALQAKI